MGNRTPTRARAELARQNGCPFCGHLTTSLIPAVPGRGFQVECLNCGARGPAGGKTPQDASRAWEYGDGLYFRPRVDLEDALADASALTVADEDAEWEAFS